MKNIKRKNGIVKYQSTTLKLSDRVLLDLDKYENQSYFIELQMLQNEKLWINKTFIRHKRRSFPIKRTFTFTNEFKTKLKKTGNMSSAVDTVLNTILK